MVNEILVPLFHRNDFKTQLILAIKDWQNLAYKKNNIQFSCAVIIVHDYNSQGINSSAIFLSLHSRGTLF